MVKRLTKEERLIDEQMLAMLEWASDNPTKWHPIGKLEGDSQSGRIIAATWRDRGLERDRSISAQTANALESTDGRGTQFSTVTG